MFLSSINDYKICPVRRELCWWRALQNRFPALILSKIPDLLSGFVIKSISVNYRMKYTQTHLAFLYWFGNQQSTAIGVYGILVDILHVQTTQNAENSHENTIYLWFGSSSNEGVKLHNPGQLLATAS